MYYFSCALFSLLLILSETANAFQFRNFYGPGNSYSCLATHSLLGYTINHISVYLRSHERVSQALRRDV